MHRSQHFICPLSRRRAAPAATERGQKLRRWPCDAIENQTRPIQYHRHSQTLLQSQLDLLFTFERVGDGRNVGQVGQQGKTRLVPSDGCRQNIGLDADLWKAMVTELIRKYYPISFPVRKIITLIIKLQHNEPFHQSVQFSTSAKCLDPQVSLSYSGNLSTWLNLGLEQNNKQLNHESIF